MITRFRPDELMLACRRLSTTSTYDTKRARDIDNRPMSSRSQALFRSNTEVKPWLATALHPVTHIESMHLRAFSRTSGGGKFRLPGSWRGNGDAATSSFSNLMIGCSPTSVYRGPPLKKCAGLRCISLRGATAVEPATDRALYPNIDSPASYRADSSAGIAGHCDVADAPSARTAAASGTSAPAAG